LLFLMRVCLTVSFLWTLLGLNRQGAAVHNPLTASYYSATPYAFGHTAVKYAFVPCSINAQRARWDAGNRTGDDFLRENMRKQLDPSPSAGAVPDGLDESCFELMLQEQQHPCHEPVEDPTRLWRGPLIRLGVLVFDKQTFLARDQQSFCAALSFNPWNAPHAHRPLGTMNHARKLTYHIGAVTRNTINHPTRAWKEPTGEETFDGPQLPLPFIGEGDTARFEYARYAAPFEDLPTRVKVRTPPVTRASAIGVKG
jgi:hypothetical protein